MKYRKKSVIIDAYQTPVELDIVTLEGVMHASVGDYIITGVNGEKYPCKPDIFEKTYDKVEDGKVEKAKNKAEWQADVLRDLAACHIELVKGKDRCYFRIKGSKGKEKSFTSYSLLDFWKEWFTPVEESKAKHNKCGDCIYYCVSGYCAHKRVVNRNRKKKDDACELFKGEVEDGMEFELL